MKNIHILQTDKPSRLIYNDANDLCYPSNKLYKNDRKWMYRKKFNIFITSDEKIKDGDWMIRGNEHPTLVTPNFFWDFGVRYYKIILTTDKDLIKEGIQSIDDEFLEFIVKNPSCEFVEVDLFPKNSNKLYEIIIPKEEPKQETLEEVAEKYSELQAGTFTTPHKITYKHGFIDGAKWQQEQILQFLYSEITERRDYSASKMCEKVIEFIKQL
jgi:hypothetical protein